MSPRLLVMVAGMLAITVPAGALAHAARVAGTAVPGFQIAAHYETGEPMQTAQVTVFAPDNPMQPWLHGLTDDNGRFAFIPDSGQPGQWTVQIRQAGHGAMVYLELAASGSLDAEGPPRDVVSAPLGTLQRWLLAAGVVWGCIGTALFFWRREPRHASA